MRPMCQYFQCSSYVWTNILNRISFHLGKYFWIKIFVLGGHFFSFLNEYKNRQLAIFYHLIWDWTLWQSLIWHVLLPFIIRVLNKLFWDSNKNHSEINYGEKESTEKVLLNIYYLALWGFCSIQVSTFFFFSFKKSCGGFVCGFQMRISFSLANWAANNTRDNECIKLDYRRCILTLCILILAFNSWPWQGNVLPFLSWQIAFGHNGCSCYVLHFVKVGYTYRLVSSFFLRLLLQFSPLL